MSRIFFVVAPYKPIPFEICECIRAKCFRTSKEHELAIRLLVNEPEFIFFEICSI
jgi:hypothetical protein